MLVKLQKFLGDAGSLRDVKSHNLSELVIQDRMEVKSTLTRLLPFIVLKERQAQIMLAIIAIYEKSRVNTRSSLSEKEFGKILRMVREIRSLNSRAGGKRTI